MEEKFFKALRDVFLGVFIEGKGGFINLMRIKSTYYQQIEEKLKTDIQNAVAEDAKFREELYDKLYSFFSRYFSESGSIHFNATPFHNNFYEKVYNEGKDIALFWKTQMLYYVKTDRIFQSIPIEIDNTKFYFDASELQQKKFNDRRALVFEFKELDDDGTLVLTVLYSEKGKKTKLEEIVGSIQKTDKKIRINEELIERACKIFERQAEVDFFINKNARQFLEEQFKLWSYQYFWDGAKEWTPKRVNQLQILKDIAFKTIAFIAQFEDELVKIWNKPKFVRKSAYVITLDRIKSNELLSKIFAHSRMDEQIREWKEIGIVSEDFTAADFAKPNKKWLNSKQLPIDTRYFKDLELEILGQFEDLDEALDGWLIKSENYQALNTTLPKFRDRVQSIYIDPPFNLDSSDQFLYRTNYKDANWATLLENRLQIAKDLLNNSGSIFVRCDYNGNWIVRCLLDEVFGKDNFRNEIVLNKSIRIKTEGKKLINWHDTFYFYSNRFDNQKFTHITEKRIEEEWRAMDTEGEAWEFIDPTKIQLYSPANLVTKDTGEIISRSRLFFGKEILPREGRRFPSQKVIDELEKDGLIRLSSNGNPQMKKPDVIYLTDNWSDTYGYASEWDFSTENSELPVSRCVQLSSNSSDLVLDFFLGSGTTTAVAHKLGRKWFGVEMGDHFYSVVLPRMKRVLAYDKSGISKDLKEYQGGGFFKYYELEQYEETLAKCRYEDGSLFEKASDPYESYVFMGDAKLTEVVELNPIRPRSERLNFFKLYDDIDLAETISNLRGVWIKAIRADEVELINGEVYRFAELKCKDFKELIWW